MLKKLWYHFFKIIVKTGLFFYSKRIKVTGREHIPKKGAILFAANHPNGLIDPLIVTTVCPRENHYLVRAAVFKKPIVKKFLSTLNLMPIYRIRDGVRKIGKNQQIFEKCFQIFKNGKTLLIFPEGSHHVNRTIRPISKGFTRIVFGALEKYPELEIKVIPVGLTYQNASFYPTKVAVNFGKPISVNEFYNTKQPVISVVKLKNEVSFQLKKLSVHIKDNEQYATTLLKLNEAQVDFTNVDFVNKMIASESIPKKQTPKKNYLTPLYKMILLNSIFPYLIWKIASKKIDEIEFVDTFRFGISTVSFCVFYIFQAWVLSCFCGWRVGSVYLIVSLFLIGMYSKFAVTNTSAS
ncbi:lysophospholipid acyltransferase family protein [Polaribacter sp.]|uniref:lysophospholipid acyltransferase family protein n=1 Tax=Polaribacter sp. TaxID=1920175 RepID=UPI003EFAB170